MSAVNKLKERHMSLRKVNTESNATIEKSSLSSWILDKFNFGSESKKENVESNVVPITKESISTNIGALSTSINELSTAFNHGSLNEADYKKLVHAMLMQFQTPKGEQENSQKKLNFNLATSSKHLQKHASKLDLSEVDDERLLLARQAKAAAKEAADAIAAAERAHEKLKQYQTKSRELNKRAFFTDNSNLNQVEVEEPLKGNDLDHEESGEDKPKKQKKHSHKHRDLDFEAWGKGTTQSVKDEKKIKNSPTGAKGNDKNPAGSSSMGMHNRNGASSSVGLGGSSSYANQKNFFKGKLELKIVQKRCSNIRKNVLWYCFGSNFHFCFFRIVFSFQGSYANKPPKPFGKKPKEPEVAAVFFSKQQN